MLGSSATTSDLDVFALLVVDVQEGMNDTAYWGPRNNPRWEDNIAALLAECRLKGRPVVLVRHNSTNPVSPLPPGQPGNDFNAIITGEADLLVTKEVSSAFTELPTLTHGFGQRDSSASSSLESSPITAVKPPPEWW